MLIYHSYRYVPATEIGQNTLHLSVGYRQSGIPADLLHCGGNFVLALVLADPLYQVLCKLRDKVFR